MKCAEFGRPSPAEILAGVGSGVTPAAVACTCICGEGPRAEQTHRLTCRAPGTCTGGRQRSWRWRWSGSPATEPSGPVTKLDPLDHLQSIPAAHWEVPFYNKQLSFELRCSVGLVLHFPTELASTNSVALIGFSQLSWGVLTI